MIRSFKDRDTRCFFKGWRIAAYQGFGGQAVRQLALLDSAETALRLARYFGTTPQLWLNLQKTWELRQVEIAAGHEITKCVTPRQSAETETAADARP